MELYNLLYTKKIDMHLYFLKSLQNIYLILQKQKSPFQYDDHTPKHSELVNNRGSVALL